MIKMNSSSRALIPWSERIVSVETVIDGGILIAKLRPPAGSTFIPIFQGSNRDLNLFVHE